MNLSPGYCPFACLAGLPSPLPEGRWVPLPSPQVPHLLPGASQLHPLPTHLIPAVYCPCQCPCDLLFLQVKSAGSSSFSRLSFAAVMMTSSVLSTVLSVPQTPSVVPAAVSPPLDVERIVRVVQHQLRINQVSYIVIILGCYIECFIRSFIRCFILLMCGFLWSSCWKALHLPFHLQWGSVCGMHSANQVRKAEQMGELLLIMDLLIQKGCHVYHKTW